MSLYSRAMRELEKAGWDMEDEWTKELLKMVEMFAQMGHSGGSAPYFIHTLERLLKFEPLTPLTDDPEEWLSRGDLQQNIRCSHVFRQPGKFNGRPYTLNGKAFSDDGGETWFTNNESAVPFDLPGFPPETERILIDGKLQ